MQEASGAAKDGFVRGHQKTATISNGESETGIIDFGRKFAYFVIACTDASQIPATTNMRAQASVTDQDTMCDLYEMNNPQTQWSKGDLPTSGTFLFVLYHALGCQRLNLGLTNPATGPVPFVIYGMDASQN